MIVKNESRVILRLLNSVLPIIDTYCICDTGSTDNTIELITTFFQQNNIPGKIVQEPFCDFGYNRSFALNECFKMPEVDYILLLDADMVLTGSLLQTPILLKDRLVADVYYLLQGNSRFYYKNCRIVRNKGYSYWGVTHEFLKTPQGTIYGNFNKNELFIEDIGDGGAKNDKWERDIRLLKKGLEDEPNNDRYTFYLANTYYGSGDYKSAIEYYKKRIEIGGWIEEVWQSYYSIGKCYESMNDFPNALYYYMEGYQAYPKRIENLYKIIQHYRNHGKNYLAYQYYMMAKRVMERNGVSNDFLFLEKDVYEYKLDYEFSIIGYYENPESVSLKNLSMKLLACPIIENGISRNILSNYKFYVESAKNFQKPLSSNLLNVISNIGKSLDIDKNEFNKSTPSLCILNNQIIINTRFVNYKIDEKGNYINKQHIISKNIITVIDLNSYEITSEFELDYNRLNDNVYVGLEDIRLFIHKDQLLYNANRGLGHSNIHVEHGSIDLESKTTKSDVLLIFENEQNSIEKNWVLFQTNDFNKNELKCVYHWFPLTIGTIEENKFIKTHQQSELPDFFRYIRGSTNGQIIDNELWFICHLVSYENRRFYYHIIVVLDIDTYKLKKYSPIFTFEKQNVEYTLGFVELGNDLFIGYSILDKETKYISISKDWFKSQMIYL
jgi:tetratricopeptide (TPR) repeat protein